MFVNGVHVSNNPKCPRCAKSVYDAESVSGAGKKWHQECFTCRDCNTRLSSMTLTEKNSEIYCSGCYAKAFGPKGFGIGGTSVTTGMNVAGSVAGRQAGQCSCGASGQTGKFCGNCGKPLSPVPASSSTNSGSFSSSSSSTGSSGSSSFSKPSAYRAGGGGGLSGIGGGSACGKCGKTVYFAEEVQGGGRKWHGECFTCNSCNTRLNSQTLTDKDGVLFCATCYAKNFGPKGYGFGGGAGTLHYTQ